MSRTVTALYDTRAQAEAARQRIAAEARLSGARIIDQDSHASGRTGDTLHGVALSHEDRHAYGEGLRRGGFLLAIDVEQEEIDRIVRLLEASGGVDLDQRQGEWRRAGWSPATAGAAPGSGGATVAEARIPVVQEELVLGRREVERGGARVRTYVREVPVHEEVTLREEHVSVERHPVDQRLDAGELKAELLRERDVEMTAVGEEAVVSKEARLREEVVVSKTAAQRTEQVHDTVAAHEVDVSPAGRGTQPTEGVTAMAQNDIPGGNATATAATTEGTTGTHAGGTGGATIGTASTIPQSGAAAGYNEARSTYQPAQSERSVTVRRQASRPSRSLVIGSAVAGAIAGGALPFMLSGRKSSASRQVVDADVSKAKDPTPTDRDPSSDRGSGRR